MFINIHKCLNVAKMCPKNLKYLEHDYSTKTQEYLEMAEIATKL